MNMNNTNNIKFMKNSRLLVVSVLMALTSIVSLAQLAGGFERLCADEAATVAQSSLSHNRGFVTDAASDFTVTVDNAIARKQLPMAEGKDIYGFTEYNLTDESKTGLIKFNTSSPAKITNIQKSKEWATAGAYADEHYYVMIIDNSFNPTLAKVNLETGEIENVAVCTLENDYALQAFEMSYDVITRKMYMVANSPADPEQYYSALLTVDLTTGVQEYVCNNMGRHFYAMAINAEGVMYGVDHNGMLCKIDTQTGSCTEVANTGLKPFYRQSMDFDRKTGIVYWAFSGVQRYGVLYSLDVTTGVPTQLGYIGGKEEQQVVGLHVPYSLYDEVAPSFVTDLQITPDAGGQLGATLSWTCPTTLIDGSQLSAIDYIEVSRDGVVVATLTDATPGATMTWHDSVEKAGTYTYKVQVANHAGLGELRTITAYVGRDVPAAVAGLKLVRTTSHSITLSWQPVEKGVNGGYIDTQSLRYKVVRTSDKTILADSLTDTTIVDEGIVELARYRYEIVSYNVDGTGGTTNSGYIVNGPARPAPIFSDFNVNNDAEANLWSVGDANGDGISYFWSYDENYGFGAYYYQTYTMQQANDWLISPPVIFEKETPYKIVVEAAPANAQQIEQFSVYLIRDYNLTTAIKIGETFDIDTYGFYRVELDSVPAGDYSVCIQCTSNGVLSNYLAVYSVEVAINGDGNIRGDVWDDSSRPVADVFVSLEGTEFGAYTDERGFFEISNVPDGNYTINSEKLGYINVPQSVTVTALQDVNVELDVIKRKAYTVSGSVKNEYGEPLADVSVALNGYTKYATTTAADGTYSITNVYESTQPYTYLASKDFYVPLVRDVEVADSNIDLNVTLNDSILPPAIATAQYDAVNRKSTIEWARPGIDESVAAYSGQISYTFGATDGTFGTLIGVVCHDPIILKSIDWFLLSSDTTVNVVVLALDENGRLTGEELYVDGDARNETFNPSVYTFTHDVYAPYGCFIGLSTDNGFLEIVTAVNTPDKPFVYNYNAYIEDYLVEPTYEYVETLGADYCENFHLGYQGIVLATDAAPAVTYNVNRENAAMMSEVVCSATSQLSIYDDAWLTLPDGEYRYAITTVYANAKESEPAYTNTLTLDKTAVDDVLTEDFTVALSSDRSMLYMNREAREVMLYSTEGTLVVSLENTSVVPVASCGDGVYMVRALVDGVWNVEKILIKK